MMVSVSTLLLGSDIQGVNHEKAHETESYCKAACHCRCDRPNCAISSECNKHRYLCSVNSNRFPPLLELWREEKAINHQTVLLLQVVNMKMKKLICVMALVCIGMLLVSCGSKRLDNPKAQFIRDFGLHIDKKDCVLEELFNNYEGFPYEGIALYKLTVGEDVRQAFLQWERIPFSKEAEHFLESLSAYVELPSIADGYWKMVDRNPGTSAYTNVSLCVYDEATGIEYLLIMDKL